MVTMPNHLASDSLSKHGVSDRRLVLPRNVGRQESESTMKDYLAKFFNDEDGAITVDFVVLTAAICTLGLIVVLAFSGNTTGLANKIEIALDKIDV